MWFVNLGNFPPSPSLIQQFSTVISILKYFKVNLKVGVNVRLGKSWVASYHQPHSWRCELKIMLGRFLVYIYIHKSCTGKC